MERKQKAAATLLNDQDRKTLNKYTISYSNYIESNTAKPDNLEDMRYKDKEL